MHLTLALLTKRPQSCRCTRETGYLLPPLEQIKENGITPGSAHALLFVAAQLDFIFGWVLLCICYSREGQLSGCSKNKFFVRHPWEMLYLQDIWSPCRLLGETLAVTFQDLSLPRALQNTSALPKRAASSQVTHPGSALPLWLNASKEQPLFFPPPMAFLGRPYLLATAFCLKALCTPCM